MLPTAMLLHVALVSCFASVTLAAAPTHGPPPPPPRRPSPYSAFRSIRPPVWFRVEPSTSRRAESFVEVPNLESPGGDFVGHPLDYGSSLNFGGPLATTVGKVKVLDYASRLNAEGGSNSRYGKPLVKPYESIYESKSQGGQKYTSATKKQKQLPRPTWRSQGESSENEIEGSSVGGGDVKDEASPVQPSQLEDDHLPPFDFATSRSGEESRESPFPEAGEMAGFFF
ncbi:uncharacterized protein LOC142579063 [Dermacentor variabilis]|uniref:uncharacterized protein LOC142579063 n=1 Tax=Dermacentor variabilis TaxID=34621 RepID=UPI003F5C3114